MKGLKITSDAFEYGETIPVRYTCDGADINPPLHIFGVPDNAASLALIVEDPDAPSGTWIHWVVWNIPVTDKLAENSAPGEPGTNDFQKTQYGGPCPPRGIHRYFFTVFALDTRLDLPESTTSKGLRDAMKSHILASGELMGVYQRK